MEFPQLFEPRFLNLEYIFNKIYQGIVWLFTSVDHYVFGGALDSGVETTASPLFSLLSTLLSFVGIFAIAVIVYCMVRLYDIRKNEEEETDAIIPISPEETEKNERWQIVQEHLNSQNPAAWRLAILEADNMLEEMVRRMGYRGENLGERLKAVEPSDFESIQSAWEAHKVRNRIAHEGSAFPLRQAEARRIIGLYEDVFREFSFI